jgi:Ca2+-binding EF-hand superfamily protein
MGGPGMMMMGGGGWGGGRGGDRGGPGGGGFGGGGFDPSQFLTRMDTNGNGSLDPEEAQGPARFMLERMARDNPKIDLTKPIAMSTLTEAFQRMRGGAGGDGRGGPSDEEILEPESDSLVPGFSTKQEKIPVPGFGASGEKFAVRVDERDLKEADDRIKRYDKNNDQSLDENEMKEGRWTDSPMQYDRNRDGKLNRQELATRQARRRNLKGDQESNNKKKEQANAARTRDAGEKKEEAKPNIFEKIASYRLTDAEGKSVRPAGLPEWFTRNDINNDAQVSMKEFNRNWSATVIEDYERFDINKDGFITTKECLAGVKKGYIPGAMSTAPASESTASSGTTSSAAPSTASPTPAASSGGDKMRAFAEKAIKKLDKDGNGLLTPEEFKETDAVFTKNDTNKDGKIDIDEYVAYRNAR